jgi:hypothetical protein
VPVDQRVTVRFQHPEVNERHFWGQMLGGPDLALITSKVRARPRALGGTAGARGRCGVPGHSRCAAPQDIIVTACGAPDRVVEGNVAVDLERLTLTWTPARRLQGATRYMVTINKPHPGQSTGPLRHSRAKEAVQGVLEWDFFTAGYQPLRVTAVYPRPHSRVRCSSQRGAENAVIVSFSNDILPSARPGQWVTVRGHELEPPLYDPSSKSLVYRFAEPLLPSEICRVRIREHLVRGAAGESLFPRQQDGMLRTSTFRWKFYSGETSVYEEHNMASSGVSQIMRRLHQGLLLPLDGSQMVPEASLRSVGYLGGDPRMMQAAGFPGYGVAQDRGAGAIGIDWLNPASLIGAVFDQRGDRAIDNGGPADASREGEWKF